MTVKRVGISIMGTKYTDYKNAYNKENYSRITLYFPKAEKESLSAYCKEKKIPVSEFVKSLVYKEVGDVICQKNEDEQE